MGRKKKVAQSDDDMEFGYLSDAVEEPDVTEESDEDSTEEITFDGHNYGRLSDMDYGSDDWD